MNERILELMRQADYPAPEMALRAQNLAELIVRECLDIVNRKEYSYHEADPLWETAQLIKQHFGVEE